MNNFFKTFFACLLAIVASGVVNFVIFIFIISGVLMSVGSMFSGSGGGASVAVQEGSVLRLDLSVPVVDRESSNPFSGIDVADVMSLKLRKQQTLLGVTTAIERAAADPRIVGIYLDVPMSAPQSLEVLYEIRQSLVRFKESGKFVVSYGDVYSQGTYYLASVGDVYVNGQGGVDWRGFSSSVMFYKGLFTKLGVEPEIVRCGKFKGAVEPFMLESLSVENRLQIDQLLGATWGYVVGQVAASRGLDSAAMQGWASDLAVGSSADAQRLGLVDSLLYRDQVAKNLAARQGVVATHFGASSVSSSADGDYGVRMVNMRDYVGIGGGVRGGDVMSSDKVAVVAAEGNIVDQGDPQVEIVGRDLAKTLAAVRCDDAVRAVVLRVNSGGGSALASDVVWREMSLLRKVKPVVVSMGSYAASGGYYIGCGADRIVASPVTLTGSIGVFGMMFDVAPGAKRHFGLTVNSVTTNPSADLGSIFRKMTPAERMFVQNGVDTVYHRFVGLVAQGRGLTFAGVDSVAQGRVWSGVQAVRPQVGLVDQLGGVQDAVELAAELAGLAGGAGYRVEVLPKVEDSFWNLFSEIGGSAVRAVASFSANSRVWGGSVLDASKAQVEQLKRELERQQGVRAQMEYELVIE